MESHFSKKFFSHNRKKLMQALPKRYPVLIVGQGLLQRAADTTYPFRQESNFWYLTGLDMPDLVLYINQKGAEYIFTPTLSDTKAIFDGAIDTRALRERSGIAHVLPIAEGLRMVAKDIAKSGNIFTTAPEKSYDVSAGVYSNPAKARVLRSLRRLAGKFTAQDISVDIALMRVHKQPEELAALRSAINLTVEAFEKFRTSKQLADIKTEYALEAAFTHHFRTEQATSNAYEPIVASGKHATTLHYIKNSGELGKDELIVVDIGADIEHYAADITRTFSLNKPTARQQAVLDEVIAIQKQAIELLRPGIRLHDYERAVVQSMGLALKRLKLISDPKDIYEIRRYYPHATSHFLGLDVHDVGDYDAPLEAGMVLTCEPGIYIPEEGIGVRIEDDILLTPTGNENLSAHCSYDAFVLH